MHWPHSLMSLCVHLQSEMHVLVVLLHPADRARLRIRRDLCLPDGPLLEWDQLHPSDKPQTAQPTDEMAAADSAASTSTQRTSRHELLLPAELDESNGMLDMSRCYPTAKRVHSLRKHAHAQQISPSPHKAGKHAQTGTGTGTGLVAGSPTVDCWMTHEQFARMSAGHRLADSSTVQPLLYDLRYVPLDESAFWTNDRLDKCRPCAPPYSTPFRRPDGARVMFAPVNCKRNPHEY